MQALKISNEDVPDPTERIGLISSMISDTFSSQWSVTAPDGLAASANLHFSNAPGVALSHALMSPLTLDNSAPNPRLLKFYAYLSNQPQTVKVQDASTLHLHPRELLILRSDVPCQIVTSRSYTTTSLVIDAALFEEYVPDYTGVIARRLRYPFGLQDLLSSTLDSCVAISEAGKFAEAGPRLTRSFLEMLAVIAAEDQRVEEVKNSTSLDIRRAQVKAFIDRNYRDPDLKITEIARRLQLTTRYIQLAFEGHDQTPSDYLRQRRIDACASELRDGLQRHRSITDIAFNNGFNSSSHFSREFKRAIGVVPREWRMAGKVN